MSRLVLFALILVLVAATGGDAQAGPMCNNTTIFPVSITEFVSCVVEGQGQDGLDSLSNVQAWLDQVLTTSISLEGSGSFCPGGDCSGDPFFGSEPGNDFVIDPSPPKLEGSTSFTFEQIPAGTQFITLKQGNAFEIFKVPGPVPFVLAHQLGGEDTSHISTFVPEPAGALLLAFGLAGLAAAGQRRSLH